MCLGVGALFMGLGAPMSASAQTLYTGTPVPNAGATDAPSVVAAPAPGLATSGVRTHGSTGLALTGTDVAELGLVGLGAVVTGTVLVRRGRRVA
ncbi:MAG: hypothetical protein M3256_24405 [Actinomycetota bacterium]|nr:hypothetical protein [Actinomycetota bacterium]